MGFRFRKSIKAGPLRINLSKSGIGYSFGVKGARISRSATGRKRATLSIPGTGLSYSKSLSHKRKKSGKKPAATPKKEKTPSKNYAELSPAKSAEPIDINLHTVRGWLTLIGAILVTLITNPIPTLIVIFLLCVFWRMSPLYICVPVAVIIVAVIVAAIVKRKRRQENQEPEAPSQIAGTPQFEPTKELNNITLEQFEAIPQTIPQVETPSVPEAIFEPAKSSNDILAEQSDTTLQAITQIEPPSVPEPGFEPVKSSNDILTEQFETALQAIPKVDIPLSDPVEKQLLKNMPDYSFNNITRATRIDSIFPLVFLDVETTGLYPSKSEIVEVSAIKFNFGMVPVSCFTSLCKPSKPIPQEASAINHITDDMVKDAPSFREIAPALTEYLRGCNVAGHNLDFDLRFIFAHGAELPIGKRFYDTLDLAHLTISKGNIWNYKLDTLCSYYGIWREQAHRSLSDCYATSKVFSKLVFDKTSRQLETDDQVVSKLDT